jgi:hypothetical protein
MGPGAAALVIAVISKAVIFDAFCLMDLVRAEVVLHFPPQVWAFFILFFTPLGGMTYLSVGRSPR